MGNNHYSSIRYAIVGLLLLVLTSCSSFTHINTPNQNDRVRSIIIHYTAATETRTMRLFENEDSQVSAHFVITDNNIYQLADLNARTYHAGVSFWRGRDSLTDTSIGIELVQEVNNIYLEPETEGHPKQIFLFPDYSPDLIHNLVKVMENIYKKYPNISPFDIVGHQDIAPTRKFDPGPRFPWQYLSQAGYGAWYDSEDFFDEYRKMEGIALDGALFYQALLLYGYQETSLTEDLFRAFQSHFTPSLVSGKVTRESMAAILALLKKYQQHSYQSISEKLYSEPNVLKGY